MENEKNNPIFQNGVWIKEQQGNLTIGSLDKNNSDVMVISDTLTKKLFEFENDMMDALYGEDREPFVPEAINIEKLFSKIQNQFQAIEIRISFSGAENNVFKGSYSQLYSIIEKFIISSTTDNDSSLTKQPIIYINASVLQDHLCIIYRDSDSISKPSKLKDEIHTIKSILKGEISHKITSGEKSYYDIMIPSKK